MFFAHRIAALIFSTLGLFQFSHPSHAQILSPSGSYPRSSRVEELLIWKISEELKLSVQEEKDLTAMIQSLDQRKSANGEKLDGIISKMNSASKDSEIKKAFAEYRSALKDYNRLSLEEVDQVEKLFPKAKAAKYFVVKSEISKKIRTLLAGRSRQRDMQISKSKPEKVQALPDPKIIEE